jgi:hypothetical protein
VAEGEPAAAQVVLEVGPEHPRLDPRSARDLVDLEHAVEAAEVDRDRSGVILTHPRLDAADDTRAAAVRDRRDPRVRAPAQDRLELRLVGRPGDQVRRVLELAAEPADDVAVRLAERVRGAVVAVGAEEAGERRRRLDPRLAQLDPVEGDRLVDPLDLETEPLVDRLRCGLEPRPVRLLVLPAPAPVLAPASRRASARYQCTPRIR